MASSSSTSFIKESYQYDVFLSFRCENTRKNFVDHLYHALGINTFKDNKRLKKGKNINDQLLKSIEESKLFIIVFSKKYASSSWGLNELVKIMECQKSNEQIAYPVFYEVNPSEVREQRGPVGEALAKRKWREALNEAANLSRRDLRNTADGHEAKVIKLIIERISLDLQSMNVNLDDELVGMEPRLQDLQKSIGLNDVRMIGIKGTGGAGKTTLARVTVDSLSNHFEAKSFVENVREVSKASLSGLLSLRRKILLDLAQGDNISSVYFGTNMLKTKLCSRKVLLVLDDVDHKDQLEALAGDLCWFKPGSRMIITTRDEQVLIAHIVKWIRDVNLLSDEEAIGLFSWDAFGKDIPVQEYETQSLKVVRYAAGLPLTVKVSGSFLCGKDKPEWVDVLARLKTIPLKVLKKLESVKLCKSMLKTLDLGLTPNLVTLDLSYCNDLVELHVLVGCLKRLTCLNLCKRERLKSVSFITDLKSLEVLNVSDLHLKEFWDYIPSHSNSNLQQLDFGGNDIPIGHLPHSISPFR